MPGAQRKFIGTLVAHISYERINTKLTLNCSALYLNPVSDNPVDLKVSKDKKVFYHYDYIREPGK